jgi:recombination protein RecR
MASLPQPLIDLVTALNRLPGIGPRSAERIALHLVQEESGVAKEFAQAVLQARERIRFCSVCGALTEADPCGLCADPQREHSLVCVVERPVDVLSIEKAGSFHGTFHVLGGKISPTNGIGPEELRIGQLEERIAKEKIVEVVLALGSDVEGDATSYYLAKRLSGKGVKVTRLAQGLPAGSGLEFADELTLNRALEGRREIQ